VGISADSVGLQKASSLVVLPFFVFSIVCCVVFYIVEILSLHFCYLCGHLPFSNHLAVFYHDAQIVDLPLTNFLSA